ncbi:MAG: succinate--CoA ligase subunit alpha [candidate division Zixibacteria bacterium]|nr:succinate--CoA ligase subunit alpha [candidate division Zixibacteria bacterium]
MSILVDKNTRVVVQGITGRDGSFHTKGMLDYGTKIVAGVTPGKGGQTVETVPVFNTMAAAVSETGANTSVVYVPPPLAVDALYEAADAGVELVVCITEGLPADDMLKVARYYEVKGVRLVGPNCPGVITPGVCKVGIMPGQIHKKGPVGVVSRSGTLTYEVVYHLTNNGIGQSTCIGIGGDPIIGTRFLDVLEMFEKDRQTEAVVLIGEIGGTDEEVAAEYIHRQMTKPVVSFIAGRTAPPGKRMGHAGAIIAGGAGTAAEKITAFRAAGVEVADTPAEVAKLMQHELSQRSQRKRAKVVSVTSKGRMAARGKTRSKSTTAKKATTKRSTTSKKKAATPAKKTTATKSKRTTASKAKSKAKAKAKPRTKSTKGKTKTRSAAKSTRKTTARKSTSSRKKTGTRKTATRKATTRKPAATKKKTTSKSGNKAARSKSTTRSKSRAKSKSPTRRSTKPASKSRSKPKTKRKTSR